MCMCVCVCVCVCIYIYILQDDTRSLQCQDTLNLSCHKDAFRSLIIHFQPPSPYQKATNILRLSLQYLFSSPELSS